MRSVIVLFSSHRISVSKVKNKTKIDILIPHVGWKKGRSELTLHKKETESHQPIPTVVNRTLKCCFTVDDTLLNYKSKILMKSINLYNRMNCGITLLLLWKLWHIREKKSQGREEGRVEKISTKTFGSSQDSMTSVLHRRLPFSPFTRAEQPQHCGVS